MKKPFNKNNGENTENFTVFSPCFLGENTGAIKKATPNKSGMALKWLPEKAAAYCANWLLAGP